MDDSKKNIRKLRLNQPKRSAAEAYLQMEKSLQTNSLNYGHFKFKPLNTGLATAG